MVQVIHNMRFAIIFTIVLLLNASRLHAQGTFTNPIAYDTLQDFLIAVLRAVVIILFPIIVLMLVYSGFLFISAQGNEGKLREARTIFFWTLVGGAIILGAEALSMAISATVHEIETGP